MGKSRNKNGSELEYLRGELKRARKKIRHLSRREHFYENIVEEIAEEIEAKEVCSSCSKGTVIVTDLKYLEIHRCDLCLETKRVKK